VTDGEQAHVAALAVCGDPSEVEQLLLDVERRVARALARPGARAAVRRVATALEDRGRLDADELAALIDPREEATHG
jgi:hypothetical protein